MNNLWYNEILKTFRPCLFDINFNPLLCIALDYGIAVRLNIYTIYRVDQVNFRIVGIIYY